MPGQSLISTTGRSNRRRTALLALPGLLALLLTLPSCSLHQRSQRYAIDLLTAGWTAYADETDFELARVSTLSGLKQIEALLLSAPRDGRLLTAAAQGFGFAALAFLEDDLETLQALESSEARLEEASKRTADFYRRGRLYAHRLLATSHPELALALEASSNDTLRSLLAETSKNELPGLFFWVFNEAGRLQLEKPDPTSLASMQSLKAALERLLELDPTYYYSGARLIAGGLDCRLPFMLGGNPKRGQAQFQKAYEETGGRFLLAHVLDASSCAMTVGDRNGYDALLAQVEAAPVDVLPGQGLLTTVAKRRAERLQRLTNENSSETPHP